MNSQLASLVVVEASLLLATSCLPTLKRVDGAPCRDDSGPMGVWNAQQADADLPAAGEAESVRAKATRLRVTLKQPNAELVLGPLSPAPACQLEFEHGQTSVIRWRQLPDAILALIRQGRLPDELRAYADEKGVVDCGEPGCWQLPGPQKNGCFFVCEAWVCTELL